MTNMDSETVAQSELNEAIDITPNKDGGVLKEILRAGEGDSTPSPENKVTVHYVGTLTDGTQFDSSRERGDKFEFELGTGKVIKAWDLGIATMKCGELAKFTCKHEYAYGEGGSPPKIPPNATLIFEVELFDWKGVDLSEDKDGGIMKYSIKAGTGGKTPNDGAVVNMKYVGRHGDRVFEERTVQFTVGEGSDSGIIEGLEMAVKKLKEGEQTKLVIASRYAYGQDGNKDFNIPPGADLEYEVELQSFEKAKESWEMDSKEKIEQSEILKAKGTKFFKAENYNLAIKNYKKIVSFLEFETGLEEAEQKQRDSLILAAHLNLAMANIKASDFHKAIEHCDKALEIDSNNIKAFFRRGQARMQQRDFEDAIKDFQLVLDNEPENKAAKNQIVICRQKIKQFYEQQKKIYSGMFSKFAEHDIKVNPNKKLKMQGEQNGEAGDNKENEKNSEVSSEAKESVETMETS
ncbi:peptidyl-prolyl cis-trans isomerase FKBP4-like [Gigantopelta aegis]|uniref:peptidyl-prolyl cis-trans isomerase FKBP4-like n=1 Tax=Gigantopelta aegis TaxID=1735272 RepID=UPI001B88A84B|nr:peptidyl-prolyl cis-trans isomerase FKBP4-like [Gigantopelta aegis]